MAEPIVIAISFPSATNANTKPKNNTAPVSLVNARKLSALKSVE